MTKYIRAIILITLMSIVLLIGYKQGYDKSAATYQEIIGEISDANIQYAADMLKYGGLYATEIAPGNATTTGFILEKNCKPVLTNSDKQEIDYSSPNPKYLADSGRHIRVYDEYTFVCTK